LLTWLSPRHAWPRRPNSQRLLFYSSKSTGCPEGEAASPKAARPSGRSRVGTARRRAIPPLEPSVRVSPHSARAFTKPSELGRQYFYCLDDSHPQVPNLPVLLGPVDTGPFDQVWRRRRHGRDKASVVRSAFSLAVPVREPRQGDAPLPLRGSVRVPQGDSSKLYRPIAGRDQLEVGPLSRGVTFKPLSRPLQPGVRFLHHPLPALPSASLAISLPARKLRSQAEIRAYPVPSQQHEQVRSCLSTGGAVVDVSQIRSETSGHLPFGRGVLRCFRPALITVFISNSLALTILFSLTPCSHAACEHIPISHETEYLHR
jgi:hypothetical protein